MSATSKYAIISLFGLILVGAALVFHSNEMAGTVHEAGLRNNRPARDRLPVPQNSSDRLGREFETKGAAAALDQAKLLEGTERENAIKFVLNMAAITGDVEFVTRELVRSGLNESDSLEVIQSLMSYWPDPSQALAWAERELTGAEKELAVGLALQKLAASDPQQAILHLETLLPGRHRDEVFGRVLTGWSTVDVQAAMAYALNTSNPDYVEIAINLIGEQWARKDPEAALLYFLKTTDDPKSIRLAHLLSVERMKENPVEAMNWVMGLNGIAGARAKRSALIAWMDGDLDAAMKFVTTADSSIRSQYAPILIATWSTKDPVAAAASLPSWPAADQDKLIAPVVYGWFQSDPAAVAKWLTSLPEGPIKDHGTRILKNRQDALNGTPRLTPETNEITRLMMDSMQDAELFQKPIVIEDEFHFE